MLPRTSGLRSSEVVLVNRFRVRNAHIEQLAWAVKAEVDQGVGGSDLYLEGWPPRWRAVSSAGTARCPTCSRPRGPRVTGCPR